MGTEAQRGRGQCERGQNRRSEGNLLIHTSYFTVGRILVHSPFSFLPACYSYIPFGSLLFFFPCIFLSADTYFYLCFLVFLHFSRLLMSRQLLSSLFHFLFFLFTSFRSPVASHHVSPHILVCRASFCSLLLGPPGCILLLVYFPVSVIKHSRSFFLF